MRLEHAVQSRGAGAPGNAAGAPRPRSSTSVVQPSSAIAPFEPERAIGGERGIGLRRQQAGQHDAAAGRDDLGQRRGEALQRLEQNVGEDEIERRVGANRRRGDAVRLHERRRAGRRG